MADISTAKKIGYRQIVKSITIGLVIAYTIFALLAGPLWIFEFSNTPALLLAVLILYGTGYFTGAYAGQLIIVKKYSSPLVGIATGFVTIWIATFAGSLVGFFSEGLLGGSAICDTVSDYILKPVAMVSFWGLIPILIIGIFYGLTVERQGRRRNCA